MQRDRLLYKLGKIGAAGDLLFGRPQIKAFLTKAMPYSTVLDLGAGQGEDLLCAQEVFKNTPPPPHFWPSHAKNLALFAVDNYLKSDEPLAKKKFEDKGIELVNLDLERDHLPFAAGSVDIIIINQVFEHVKAVFWILHEITRVLKPGGHLIVGVPNLAALHQRLLLLFGQQPSCIKNYSNHIRGYTKGDLIRLVNSAFDGWQLKHFGGGDFRPFPAFLAKPLAKIFPTLSGTIFFDFQKIKDYPDNGYLKAARQGYCLSSK